MPSTRSPAVPENSSKAVVFSTQPTMKWSVLDGCSSRQHTIKSHLFESFCRPCILISKSQLDRRHHALHLILGTIPYCEGNPNLDRVRKQVKEDRLLKGEHRGSLGDSATQRRGDVLSA